MAGLLATAALGIAARLLAGHVRRTRPPDSLDETRRWRARPVLSGLLLVLAHGVPVAAAVTVSALVSRHVERPVGLGRTIEQWLLLIALSTAVLLVVDRLARRLLPLAALLRLAMVFPDRAPTRLAVARKSGSVRDLKAVVARAEALGEDSELTHAAVVILSLVGALHAHDRHTRGHSERVRWFTDLLADELKLSADDRDRLRWASLLHDIGKLQVHSRILNKPGKLGVREWRAIHRHPEEGAKLAAPLAPWLGEWASTIEQHHERWDGQGYPYGLRGNEIGLGARIVGVADAFEVMTANRPYKKAMSASAARRELTKCAGTHFDPTVVRAFLNISLGRLRWVAGPVAWVAQIPFVGWLPRLAEGAAAMSGPAAGAAATAVGVVALGSSGLPTAGAGDLPAPPTDLSQTSVPVTVAPSTRIASTKTATTQRSPATVLGIVIVPTTTAPPLPGHANPDSSASNATSATSPGKAPDKATTDATAVAHGNGPSTGTTLPAPVTGAGAGTGKK